MAKISNPYSCDECGVAKKPSNGWFLLFETIGNCVQINKWDEEKAVEEGVKHLCGVSCVLKVTGRELVKFYGLEQDKNDRNL